MLSSLRKELNDKADHQRAEVSQRYFKTGPGEYGHGDIFLGLSAPERRKLAKKYGDIKLPEVVKLLRSKIHEERDIALLILVDKYKTTPEVVYNLYLENTKHINNWDLVDLSADKIVGEYLFDKPKQVLYKLANSKNLWERRIAIMATYHFIKKNKFAETLKLAEILLSDRHDLIHKAVGWMLREIGKRDLEAEEDFLKKHALKMPRVMLRYAIEKFPAGKRKRYLLE